MALRLTITAILAAVGCAGNQQNAVVFSGPGMSHHEYHGGQPLHWLARRCHTLAGGRGANIRQASTRRTKNTSQKPIRFQKSRFPSTCGTQMGKMLLAGNWTYVSMLVLFRIATFPTHRGSTQSTILSFLVARTWSRLSRPTVFTWIKRTFA